MLLIYTAIYGAYFRFANHKYKNEIVSYEPKIVLPIQNEQSNEETYVEKGHVEGDH